MVKNVVVVVVVVARLRKSFYVFCVETVPALAENSLRTGWVLPRALRSLAQKSFFVFGNC
jgi:hypothetical protein